MCTAKIGRFAYLSWRAGLASRFVQFLYSLYSFDTVFTVFGTGILVLTLESKYKSTVFGTIPSLIYTNLAHSSTQFGTIWSLMTTIDNRRTSTRYTRKPNFTLYDVVCYDVAMTWVWRHVSHYLAPNKKPKMATSDLKCEFLQLENAGI